MPSGCSRATSGCSILGLDRDEIALAAARQRLARFGDRLMVHHCRFDRLEDAMEAFSVDNLSGALVRSRRQFAAARRCRSRVLVSARRRPRHAHGSIASVDRRRRRQRLPGRAADRGSCSSTATSGSPAASPPPSSPSRPIETTTELAAIVVAAIPAPARRTGGHPAKRTFQAIRIEVNGELDALAPAIDAAIASTDAGGRIAVLSYHSGEDRIVKERMRLAVTGGCECPPELPCVCDAVQTVRIVRGVPRTPSAAEQADNRRASSARLRVAERIADTPRRGSVG